MMRRGCAVLAALFVVLASVWAVPTEAWACSCKQASEDEYVAWADVIFTGQINEDRSDQQTRTITFTVDRIYKGDTEARQVVTTSASGASCGLEISGAGSFLVFANRADEPGQLTANLCGGTRAGGAPAILGEGRPAPPESASPSGSASSSDPASPSPPAARPNTGPLLLIIGVVVIIGAFRIAALARRSRQ